jgi:hypothetical protein
VQSLVQPSELKRIAALPKMKAVRHPIHDEPDDQFVLRDDFNRGIAELKQFDLGYDLLIFEKHLPQTIEFVDRQSESDTSSSIMSPSLALVTEVWSLGEATSESTVVVQLGRRHLQLGRSQH